MDIRGRQHIGRGKPHCDRQTGGEIKLPYVLRITRATTTGEQIDTHWAEALGEAYRVAEQAYAGGRTRVDMYEATLIKDDVQIRADIAVQGSGQSSP